MEMQGTTLKRLQKLNEVRRTPRTLNEGRTDDVADVIVEVGEVGEDKVAVNLIKGLLVQQNGHVEFGTTLSTSRLVQHCTDLIYQVEKPSYARVNVRFTTRFSVGMRRALISLGAENNSHCNHALTCLSFRLYEKQVHNMAEKKLYELETDAKTRRK